MGSLQGECVAKPPQRRSGDHPTVLSEVTICCLLALLLQTVKKGSVGQLHFKGDSIDRPPTSREWAWLMHRLVALSKWANAKLGLDKLPEDGEIAETQIKVVYMCPRTCR